VASEQDVVAKNISSKH